MKEAEAMLSALKPSSRDNTIKPTSLYGAAGGEILPALG
jgi:hypothetical protein